MIAPHDMLQSQLLKTNCACCKRSNYYFKRRTDLAVKQLHFYLGLCKTASQGFNLFLFNSFNEAFFFPVVFFPFFTLTYIYFILAIYVKMNYNSKIKTCKS